MSEPAAVSVLLPVRDAAPFLAEALDSLRRQTFEDLEILVHDDGSTDDSRSIARRAAQEDSRIRLETGSPRGIVHALNALAARAGGDLFVRMDADDVSAPTRVERLVEAARARPAASFFASRVRYVPRAGLSEGVLRYETWINALLDHESIVRERFVECPLPHPAWAIRRETLERLGGWADGPFPEDYELFLRAVDLGIRFHKVDEVLLDWREGDHRLSRTSPRFSRAAFFELKARHLVPFLAATGRPVVVFGTGPAGKRWTKRLREGGLEVDATDGVHANPEAFVIGTCGTPEGREKTRRDLDAAGLVEGADYLCVQ